MRSLLLVSLLLAPGSLVFGQAENPVPRSSENSRQERMRGFWQQVDVNHDGQIDAEEIQAAGARVSMIEGMIRRAGLEPKYPIKISDIQEAMQKVRSGGEAGGGFIGGASSKEPPKFKSLKEILEAMPRKPEKGDNNLASKVANKWLQSNAIGSVIQISGKVSHIGQTSSRDGFLISLSLESKQGVWEGYNFNLSVHAMAPPKADINDYSKISQGNIATVEGIVSNLEMEWERGNGSIRLSLSDCKLVSVNKPEAKATNIAEGTEVQNQPNKSKLDAGPTTVSGGILTIQKAGKFWSYATENGEYAIRLGEVAYVQLFEAKTNNPMNWHIFIYLKTKDSPIILYFNEKDKAHAVYQSLLQTLDSNSGSQVIEGMGANPEAGFRGTVRIQNAPVEKPNPPEEKKEKGLFD